MLLARRSPAFHRKTLRESGGEEAGGIEGQPGARDGGEEAEEEDTEWADGDKKCEDEGECSISRRRARLYSGGIRVRVV